MDQLTAIKTEEEQVFSSETTKQVEKRDSATQQEPSAHHTGQKEWLYCKRWNG